MRDKKWKIPLSIFIVGYLAVQLNYEINPDIDFEDYETVWMRFDDDNVDVHQYISDSLGPKDIEILVKVIEPSYRMFEKKYKDQYSVDVETMYFAVREGDTVLYIDGRHSKIYGDKASLKLMLHNGEWVCENCE